MDGFRYSMAVIVLLVWPAALVFWFLVHPFVAFWRRLGPERTYGFVGTVMVGVAVLFVFLRETLLTIDLGTRPFLCGCSSLPAVGWIWVAIHRRRVLNTKTLTGLAELAPDRFPVKLLTEGIYAHVRHPRYVEIALGLLFFALLTNFLAIYILLALGWIGIYGISVLEDRELARRFGEEHHNYARRVPRFLPRRRPRASNTG